MNNNIQTIEYWNWKEKADIVTELDGNYRVAKKDFIVKFAYEKRSYQFFVHKGFKFKPTGLKLLNIPSRFHHKIWFAALIHDFIYSNSNYIIQLVSTREFVEFSRKDADAIFANTLLIQMVEIKHVLDLHFWIKLFGWFWWVT